MPQRADDQYCRCDTLVEGRCPLTPAPISALRPAPMDWIGAAVRDAASPASRNTMRPPIASASTSIAFDGVAERQNPAGAAADEAVAGGVVVVIVGRQRRYRDQPVGAGFGQGHEYAERATPLIRASKTVPIAPPSKEAW